MAKGFSDVLVGLQYGDEGKGRVIDNIMPEYDINARFNGGPNAGHTIECGDIHCALHHIPSAVLHKDKMLYIGSGCVINPIKLINELAELQRMGIDLADRFLISDQATVIMPSHIEQDKYTGKGIGTTGNGIGPAYAAQAIRAEGGNLRTLRMCEILDNPQQAVKALEENYLNTRSVYGIKGLTKKKMKADIEAFMAAMETVQKFVVRDPLWLDKQVQGGKNVLFEGAQATMLDVTKGALPYLTSSHTVAGSAYVGGDLSPQYHRKTIGVAKAIPSRVGNGPFPSEFGGRQSEEYCNEGGGYANSKSVEYSRFVPDTLLTSEDMMEVGIAMRMKTGNYGASTGRPRRTGKLDAVALRNAVQINGVVEMYLNQLDLLELFTRTRLGRIPVVKSYVLEGRAIDYVPSSESAQRALEPVEETMDPIGADISHIRDAFDLPGEALAVIQKIEQLIGCKIVGAGVGPKREQFVSLR